MSVGRVLKVKLAQVVFVISGLGGISAFSADRCRQLVIVASFEFAHVEQVASADLTQTTTMTMLQVRYR